LNILNPYSITILRKQSIESIMSQKRSVEERNNDLAAHKKEAERDQIQVYANQFAATKNGPPAKRPEADHFWNLVAN
jgi:hypothetical protein